MTELVDIFVVHVCRATQANQLTVYDKVVKIMGELSVNTFGEHIKIYIKFQFHKEIYEKILLEDKLLLMKIAERDLQRLRIGDFKDLL